MSSRQYYSARRRGGKGNVRFFLPGLRDLFLAVYQKARTDGLFLEAFGYKTPRGMIAGTLGEDPGLAIYLAFRRSYLWPISPAVKRYSRDDIFDMIEFLYDHASKPTYSLGAIFNPETAQPIDAFDRDLGRNEFRLAMNEILKDYDSGWQLTEAGEVVPLPDEGFDELLAERLPAYDPENVEQRVDAATRKFWSRGSTADDRHDAVRDLADVLEFLRPKAAKYFLTNKDDDALFSIANGFAIRHHDGRQKGDYDIAIWYNWIFYVYLATIHAAMKAIKAAETKRRDC